PGGFRQVVDLCDGTRTLPQVLEGSSLDDWGTLRVLVRFLKLGMLEHGQAAKRGLPHLGVQIPVDFQSLRAFRGGHCFDLSARGIFLRTSEVFPVGEDLLLRFKLPGVAHPFRTAGRVVWSSPTDTPKGLPAGMGIQFLDLSEEERGTLERFIVELLSSSSCSWIGRRWRRRRGEAGLEAFERFRLWRIRVFGGTRGWPPDF
ncbi:MAG: TIGR02266 family protein, partial [candidate division NC10 bacterium]|nr:TIGR02266 family protein [candidate division NC10 bacterium]